LLIDFAWILAPKFQGKKQNLFFLYNLGKISIWDFVFHWRGREGVLFVNIFLTNGVLWVFPNFVLSFFQGRFETCILKLFRYEFVGNGLVVFANFIYFIFANFIFFFLGTLQNFQI